MTARGGIAASYRTSTPGQVVQGITEAITACDSEAVAVLLGVLAVKAPAMARAVRESMAAILSAAPEGADPGDALR